MRAKQRRFQDKGPQARPADLDPRRRRLRRPGAGGRDLEPLATAGLSDRRHDPHRGQQPDRLHDLAERGPLDALLHRRGQDDRGADLPRQRRGPRGGRLRRRAGHSTSARPSARTSSSTWSATAATATTRATSRRSPSRSCTRRSATGSASASSTPSSSSCPASSPARRPRRSPRPSPRRCRRSSRRSRCGASSRVPSLRGYATGPWAGLTPRYSFETGRDRRLVRRCSGRSPKLRPGPRRLHGQPQAGRIFAARVKTMESTGHGRLGVRREAGLRLAAARGHPGAAQRPGQPPRHLQPAACRAGRPADRRALEAAQSPERRASPSSASTTACSPRRPCSGSTTATRWTSPTC